MKVIKNKKGMGIPTVLAIVVFILGTAASLMTITYQSAHQIEQNIDRDEAYYNAIDSVDAAVKVIIRGLLDDSAFLNSTTNIEDVEAYFEVDVSQYPDSTSLWQVTSIYAPNKTVSSYVSTTAGGSLSPEEASDLMSYFGTQITSDIGDMPEDLLAVYLPIYFEMNEVDATREPSENDLASVKKISKYVADRTDFIEVSSSYFRNGGYFDGNFVIEGDLTLKSGKTLEIAPGKALFITGTLYLEPNTTVIGNYIVGTSVYFYDASGASSTFIGTMYVNQHFMVYTDLIFGTIDRPSFVFSSLTIRFFNDGFGYGFFVSPSFIMNGAYDKVVTVNGGVITDDEDIRKGTLIVIPYDLSAVYQFFETYALPYDGTINVEGSYTYTTPR